MTPHVRRPNRSILILEPCQRLDTSGRCRERYHRAVMHKIAVAAIISLAAGCDGGPTGPTIDVPVSGRVLDYATGGGVPGTAVAFGASTAVTDTNGLYSLVIPEVGHFEPAIDGRT